MHEVQAREWREPFAGGDQVGGEQLGELVEQQDGGDYEARAGVGAGEEPARSSRAGAGRPGRGERLSRG
jgi:hypothetical protein